MLDPASPPTREGLDNLLARHDGVAALFTERAPRLRHVFVSPSVIARFDGRECAHFGP